MLVSMIEALDERGPDSSGIAVYADDPAPAVRPPASMPAPVKISLGSDEPVDWLHIGDTLSQRFGTAIDPEPSVPAWWWRRPKRSRKSSR